MKNLANEFINYYWSLLFNAEDTYIDENFVSDEIERLSFELSEQYSQEEQEAVIAAAKSWLKLWTAEPDEHGYTRRKLLTSMQKEFLESLASGKFLEQES